MAGEPDLRRKLWHARGSCFLQIGCAAQLSVYEAVHMMEQGLNGTLIGLLLALENALIIITSPFWGRVADRFRFHRRLIAIGTIGLSFCLLWFAYADSPSDFLFYAILRGVLFPTIMGVMPALVLGNLAQGSEGEGYGDYRSYGSIGFMAATLLLPALLSSITNIAIVAAALLPLSLIFVFSLDRPQPRTASEEAAFSQKLPTLLYWFLAANFLVSLTDPAINGFYNSFAKSLGAPLEWIGVLSSLNGFLGFIFLPLTGRWVDWKGANLILILGFSAQSLRLLTASFMTAPEWLWLPQLFHGFGWAGREVASIVFVTLLCGPTRRATAVTLLISTKMAGMTTGSFLMGWLSDLFGYPIMFRIIAVLAGFSLVLLLFVLSRKPGLKRD
ncbi:MAG: MFS transporter [Puniceicoccaceae bacterium]